MTLLAAQATLAASSEAAIRQAASASKAAEDLLAQKESTASDENTKEVEENFSKLKEELDEARKGKRFYELNRQTIAHYFVALLTQNGPKP